MDIFPETYAVGAQFGVVLVPLPGNQVSSSDENTPKADAIEVATFRSDHGYSDGRRPDEVRFSLNPQEDVERRDFTINGMLLDPLTNEVLDFVGGRKDLEAGIIRTIGDPEKRFAEDKLRMLRAVRFAARFEFEIEAETLAAIQRRTAEIRVVSRERVRDELTKMLIEGHARRAFLLLDESGLLREVLPEISAMKGVQQPPEFHPEGDVFVHTLLLLENLPRPCPPALAWGALLHDVGKPATFRVAPDRIRFDNHVDVGVKIAEEICQRLRFSVRDAGQVLALVDNHMRFGHVTRMKESTLKKFIRLPNFDQHLALHRTDSLASHGNLSTYDFLQKKLTEIPPEKIRPRPLVTGDDLIAAGYMPGPKFREILEAVEDAQLEGRLLSHDAALEFVKREFTA
jgi:poly(A) polymerase